MNPQVADCAIIRRVHEHRGSHWVYMYSLCHQMITQQWPMAKIAIFRPTDADLKMAKSSLVGPRKNNKPH